MMTRLAVAWLIATVIAPASADAQSGANPLVDAVKNQYGIVKGYLAKTAEKVPEEVWSFQPTPEVRTFGQLIGHVADSQFSICSAAADEKPPQTGIEKAMKSKAELTKALAESTAYCDRIANGMDDKKGMEPIKFFGGMQPRAMVLSFNVAHDFEHYGNLVTYMRLKNIVPPSSEGQR
ncbi:MAG: DinB family protein [Acidobacteria bacterium]|nr:DinB family protein [Acidobacteriota bacterium]